MSAFLDASVLVALFTKDAFSQRADLYLRNGSLPVVVADFAAAEFASGVARKVRMGELTVSDARDVFLDFDSWTARAASRAETSTTDIAAAAALVRRLDLALRAPDAINIVLAQRLGVELATFDLDMARAARGLGAALSAI